MMNFKKEEVKPLQETTISILLELYNLAEYKVSQAQKNLDQTNLLIEKLKNDRVREKE